MFAALLSAFFSRYPRARSLQRRPNRPTTIVSLLSHRRPVRTYIPRRCITRLLVLPSLGPTKYCSADSSGNLHSCHGAPRHPSRIAHTTRTPDRPCTPCTGLPRRPCFPRLCLSRINTRPLSTAPLVLFATTLASLVTVDRLHKQGYLRRYPGTRQSWSVGTGKRTGAPLHYTPLTRPSYTPHTPLIHPPYTPHTPLIHPSYTPHTPIIRPSYTPHTPLIHPSHPPHTHLTPPPALPECPLD